MRAFPFRERSALSEMTPLGHNFAGGTPGAASPGYDYTVCGRGLGCRLSLHHAGGFAGHLAFAENA
jgi:hypothetical protein